MEIMISFYTKLVKNTYDKLLKSKDFVLLEPMDYIKRGIVRNIVECYPDLVAFTVGQGKEKNLVIRYIPLEKEDLDINRVIKSADKAFYSEEYAKCISLYLKLFQLVKIHDFVFAKMGLSYLKLGEVKKAVDCLYVATEISRRENGKFDYTDFIKNIKDNNKNIDVNNVDEVINYILNANLDVDSACLELKMNPYQINIFKLKVAKRLYKEGDYKKGDEFFFAVEKSKDKTTDIISLMEKLQKNKKFYVNRNIDSNNSLVLSLRLNNKNKGK